MTKQAKKAKPTKQAKFTVEVYMTIREGLNKTEKTLKRNAARDLGIRIPASVKVVKCKQTDIYESDGDVFFDVTFQGPAAEIDKIRIADELANAPY